MRWEAISNLIYILIYYAVSVMVFVVVFVLSLCFFEFSDGVRVFVIGPSWISSFFSFSLLTTILTKNQ